MATLADLREKLSAPAERDARLKQIEATIRQLLISVYQKKEGTA